MDFFPDNLIAHVQLKCKIVIYASFVLKVGGTTDR